MSLAKTLSLASASATRNAMQLLRSDIYADSLYTACTGFVNNLPGNGGPIPSSTPQSQVTLCEGRLTVRLTDWSPVGALRLLELAVTKHSASSSDVESPALVIYLPGQADKAGVMASKDACELRDWFSGCERFTVVVCQGLVHINGLLFALLADACLSTYETSFDLAGASNLAFALAAQRFGPVQRINNKCDALPYS